MLTLLYHTIKPFKYYFIVTIITMSVIYFAIHEINAKIEGQYMAFLFAFALLPELKRLSNMYISEFFNLANRLPLKSKEIYLIKWALGGTGIIVINVIHFALCNFLYLPTGLINNGIALMNSYILSNLMFQNEIKLYFIGNSNYWKSNFSVTIGTALMYVAYIWVYNSLISGYLTNISPILSKLAFFLFFVIQVLSAYYFGKFKLIKKKGIA